MKHYYVLTTLDDGQEHCAYNSYSLTDAQDVALFLGSCGELVAIVSVVE